MFTADELKVIIQLADIAMRSQGLNVAQTALHIVGKCQAELKKETQPETVEE